MSNAATATATTVTTKKLSLEKAIMWEGVNEPYAVMKKRPSQRVLRELKAACKEKVWDAASAVWALEMDVTPVYPGNYEVSWIHTKSGNPVSITAQPEDFDWYVTV